ncbi:MAG: hypothetical protein L3J84_01925 [Gammaproteobacteria bacterium]|nr:hypothetical protein [Gammaproteobacteria bacterium]
MSDQPDNQFNDDKKISTLYRAGSTAQPPKHIDQAIRAEARRSVSSTPPRVRSPWAVPVSMAAVLALSVSLISLIHEEAPTVSDIRSDVPVIHTEEREITEYATKEKSAARQETSSDRLSVTEITDMAQPDIDTEQKAERQKTKVTKPSLQKSQVSAKIKEELTFDAAIETSDEMSQESVRRIIPQPKSPSPASGRAGASIEFSTGLKKDLGTKASENCEQLSHSACLNSEQCSLVVNEIINDSKTLVCRRSMSHCDTGFIQRSDTKESCESRQGCMYISDPCFCPPDVLCICNGGQPPQCQPRKNGTPLQSE